MKMNKKLITALLIVVIALVCINIDSPDLSDRAIVEALGLDYEDNRYILTVQFYNPTATTAPQKSQTKVLKGEGKTISQAIEDIKEVRTHYMAINQTREFFKDYPWIRLVESEDTAKSAAEVALMGLKGVGAVASELAAELYGLEVLAESIETYKQNFTRFLIFDDALEVDKADVNKASMCFTLSHTPGSLAHVLTILSFYGMNLTRIQSLPIPGQEWQYFFYVDIKFDDHLRYEQALAAVRPLMEDLNILGEYTAAI